MVMLLKQKGPISHSGTPEKPFIIIANEGQQLKRMHAESNPFTTMAWIIFGVKFAFRKNLSHSPSMISILQERTQPRCWWPSRSGLENWHLRPNYGFANGLPPLPRMFNRLGAEQRNWGELASFKRTCCPTSSLATRKADCRGVK